jgi:hypothetical protein
MEIKESPARKERLVNKDLLGYKVTLEKRVNKVTLEKRVNKVTLEKRVNKVTLDKTLIQPW